MLTSKEMAESAVDALEEKKSIDIRVIDISEVSAIADYFIIGEGSNKNQVQAIADEVEERLGRAGANPKQIEGYPTANWILMDYRDVIVHIFDTENRQFYNLEHIWKDGREIDSKDL